jgi:hypothetical protein
MSLSLRWTGREDVEPVFPPGTPSAALSEFFSRLRNRSRPRLYDIGPAPGGNIVCFAGQGLIVYVDAERDHRIAGTAPDRLDFEDGVLDAAVLWDVVDFLPTARAEGFIADLTRAMRPGGLVFLLSSAARAAGPEPVFTYFVKDGFRIDARPIQGTLATRIPRENRDILRMFDRFENLSLHLLRSQMREMLLKRR